MTAEKSFWTNLTLTLNIDLPAIMLGIMLLISAYVMWSAQKKEGFDFGNMLRDENGKESAVRIGVLVSLGVSSWTLMNHALLAGKDISEGIYSIYVFGWSGALVFVKVADKWSGTLPWSK
jgi:energy-coupling factor transporter transmembrane protein EcfT